MHNHSNCSTKWEERQKTNFYQPLKSASYDGQPSSSILLYFLRDKGPGLVGKACGCHKYSFIVYIPSGQKQAREYDINKDLHA